jgi:putative oxidoreductase
MTRLVDLLISLLAKLPQSLIALIGRLTIGLTFWNSGRTKVDGWNIFHVNDKTLFLFREEYKLPVVPPEIAALAAQVAEHVLPALLIVGLATRFSALGLFIMTLVIQVFVYPNAFDTHGVWAVALLFIMVHGPGRLSLDWIIGSRGAT